MNQPRDVEIVADVCRTIAEMKGSGKRGTYSHIAKEKNVPEGCLSNWWKNREKYYKTAAKKMNVRLMGVKARRLMEKRGKSRLVWKMDPARDAIISHMVEQIIKRRAERKAVSLGICQRIMRKKLTQMKAIGFEVKSRQAKPWTASKSHVWRCMILAGFKSRKKGCRRTTTPAAIAAGVVVLLHPLFLDLKPAKIMHRQT